VSIPVLVAGDYAGSCLRGAKWTGDGCRLVITGRAYEEHLKWTAADAHGSLYFAASDTL
jgi:hypothetical protein